MSIPVHHRSTQQQLDLLRALVSYSFANLLSARRLEFQTRGAKAKDKHAIAFRANEITGSINAALISAELKDNASFPLLVETQLHALREAVNSALSPEDIKFVGAVLEEWTPYHWEPILSESNYDKMKPLVRELIAELVLQRRASGRVAYSVFVEYAAALWSVDANNSDSHFEILREIRFSPEHQQAGIAILSYFSVILRQKLPSIIASVSIRQDIDKVVLVISYPDGTEEEVAQALADYGMVVRGELLPESFLGDPLQVIALKQKLEIVSMELRLAKELHAVERATNDARFKTLESEVTYLREQLANQLQLGSGVSQQLLEILRDVTQIPAANSMEPLLAKLIDAILKRDEDELRIRLNDLKEKSPNMLNRLNEFILTSSVGGVIGSVTYDWLKLVWPILPR